MNISRLISSIKGQLGLYNVTLPFKDEITGKPIPVENVIRDVLVNTTIPTFSQFQPWVRELDANINSLKVVNKESGVYMLPPMLTTTEVMYVLSVRPSYNNHRGFYGAGGTPALGIGMSAQNVATGQAALMLTGQMRNEPTFDYIGENKIRLYGYPKAVTTFRVACEHEPNGETIPTSCYDSFHQLAILDVKMFLYNTLKHYDNIPTAFGNIQLKSEDNQAAESERTTLIDKWTDTFHLDLDEEMYI